MEYDRIRSYEVSVWTLLDEFITVLKPSNLENKGQIEEGKIELNVDGTQNISFKIPMYLEPEVVNPIWYDVENGVLAANMRKIKTIFNKGTEEEKVFEFIIINAEETHLNDELYYDVRGEGLAFHELGKRGYKLELSNNNYKADEEVQAWYNGDETYLNSHSEPIANILYWLKTINIPPANSVSDAEKPYTWCYELQMDWSSFTGGEDLASDKIYDEGYVSWDYVYNINNNNYEPVVASVELPREKSRLIEISESNIYNITLKLAEVFGVFCKYEYSHDLNYHITGKKIVFYNKFYSEKLGFLDFTYPYSAEEIKRTVDSSDLVTKLYVKNIEDSTSASGVVTILDAEVNKSKEDYILNFDYLHEIKTISDELYLRVIEFENTMSSYNAQIEPIDKELVILLDLLIDLLARATIAKNAALEDNLRIEDTVALYNNLTGNGATLLSRGITNPDATVLKQDLTKNDNHYFYVDIGEKGAIAKTIKVYKTLNYVSKEFSNEITGGVPQYDEYGNVVRFSNLYADPEDRKSVYVTYDYRPRLYYENVEAVWRKRFSKDSVDAQSLAALVTNLQNLISEKLALKDAKLALKKAEISDFEKEMGPAIREGYWQPEGYTDYGNRFIDSFRINISPSEGTIACKTPYASFIWDTEPFPGETENSYQIGVNLLKEYYTYVLLRNNIDVPAIKDHLNELNYLYYNYLPASDWEINRIKSLPLGSLCELGFVKDDINYNPAVILTGDRCLSDLSYFTDGRGFLGSLHTVVDTDEKKIIIDSTSYVAYNSSRLLKLNSNRKIAYPRIKIASLALKIGPDNLGITYGGHELKEFEDYYINFKDEAYYITLKPEALVRYGTVDKVVSFYYTLSTASNSVYLDALEVSRENAYPKVSYEIDPNVYGRDFMHTAYNTLGTLAHINDVKLKFNNVMGYISKVELDLDKPWEDLIEIKNYKNKFEDLFSTIVAQTEAMKAAEPILNSAANIVTLDGTLAANAVKDIIRHVDLDYAFNNGTLTIDNENGIWGTSDSGVVAFRGGGIFTSTEQNENGDWKWNTGITPEGINANLITTGQLDTNLINIYAGDNIKFLMNGNGIFAYRSFLKDIEAITDTTFLTKILTVINNNQDVIDKKQYVMYNEDGLFLIADQGAFILNEDRDDFISQVDSETGLHLKATRVEISWDGLILRDWENNKVFYADPDTGNLTLTGIITATGGDIGGWKISQNSLYNTGIELRSIPGNDTQSAGIFVTSDTIDNYIVKDNNNVEYYIYNYYNSPNAEPVQYYSTERLTVLEVSAVTRPSIYKPEETVAIVTPLYTVDEVVTEEKEETFEVDIGDGLTEERTVTQSYTYTLYYIADENRNKVIGRNGEPVIYDGTTDPNLANNPWLNALTANQRNTLVLKTTKIVENSYVPIGLTELSNGSLLLLQTFEPSLSIEAKTGKLTTNSAQLGKFILTANSLSGLDEGTLNNTKIIQSKILEGEIEGKSTKDFLRAFCDFSGNSATGTFTLTRIDGTSVNFNITAMQKYQMDMAVQYNSGYSGGYSQGYASGRAAGGGGGGSSRTADSILTTVTLTDLDVTNGTSSYPVTVHYNNNTTTSNISLPLNLSGIHLTGYRGMEFGNSDEGEEGIIKLSNNPNSMTTVAITADGHIDKKAGSNYIYVVWHEAKANGSLMAVTEAVEIGEDSYNLGKPTAIDINVTNYYAGEDSDTGELLAYINITKTAKHESTIVYGPVPEAIPATDVYRTGLTLGRTNYEPTTVTVYKTRDGSADTNELGNPSANVYILGKAYNSTNTLLKTSDEISIDVSNIYGLGIQDGKKLATVTIGDAIPELYGTSTQTLTGFGQKYKITASIFGSTDPAQLMSKIFTTPSFPTISGVSLSPASIPSDVEGSRESTTTATVSFANNVHEAIQISTAVNVDNVWSTAETLGRLAGKDSMKILLNASSQDTAAVSLTDGNSGAKNYNLVVNTQMQYSETTHRYTAIADVTVGGTPLISDTDTRLNFGMQGYNDGLKNGVQAVQLVGPRRSDEEHPTTLIAGQVYEVVTSTGNETISGFTSSKVAFTVPVSTSTLTFNNPTLSGGSFGPDGQGHYQISGITVTQKVTLDGALLTDNNHTATLAISNATYNSIVNGVSIDVEKTWSNNICTCSPKKGTGSSATINISQNVGSPSGNKYPVTITDVIGNTTVLSFDVDAIDRYNAGFRVGQNASNVRITPKGSEGDYPLRVNQSIVTFKALVRNLSNNWEDVSNLSVNVYVLDPTLNFSGENVSSGTINKTLTFGDKHKVTTYVVEKDSIKTEYIVAAPTLADARTAVKISKGGWTPLGNSATVHLSKTTENVSDKTSITIRAGTPSLNGKVYTIPLTDEENNPVFSITNDASTVYTNGLNSMKIKKGPWSNGAISLTKSTDGTANTHTITLELGSTTWGTGNYANIAYVPVLDNGAATGFTVNINAKDRYNAGWTAAYNKVMKPKAGSATSFSVNVPKSTVDSAAETLTFTLAKDATPSASGYVKVNYGSLKVALISIGDWYTAGASGVTITRGNWSSGNIDFTSSADSTLKLSVKLSTTKKLASATVGNISYDIEIKDSGSGSAKDTGKKGTVMVSMSTSGPNEYTGGGTPTTLTAGKTYSVTATLDSNASTTKTILFKAPSGYTGLKVSGATISADTSSTTTSITLTAGTVTATRASSGLYTLTSQILINNVDTGVTSTGYFTPEESGYYNFTVYVRYSGGTFALTAPNSRYLQAPSGGNGTIYTYNSGYAAYLYKNKDFSLGGNAVWRYTDDPNTVPADAALAYGYCIMYAYERETWYPQGGNTKHYWFACTG